MKLISSRINALMAAIFALVLGGCGTQSDVGAGRLAEGSTEGEPAVLETLDKVVRTAAMRCLPVARLRRRPAPESDVAVGSEPDNDAAADSSDAAR